MVALLITLKLRLLRGSLRGSTSQQIGFVLGVVGGLGAALAGVTALIGLRLADPDVAGPLVVGGGAVLVLGWGVVPMLISGVDETLDPSRFALLPVRARQLVPGLMLAGLVGIPGMVTTVVAAFTVVTWWRGVLPVLLAVPGAVLGVLTSVLVSRLLTTSAARVLARRRYREVGAAVAVLLLSSAGLWPALLAGEPRWDDITDRLWALGWTPIGLAWAAPADAATGHVWRGLLRLTLAGAVIAAGAIAWERLLDRALADGALIQHGAGAGRSRLRRRGVILDRLPSGPTWGVVVRSLRYWRRDPRYLVAFSAIAAGSLVPLVATRTTGNTQLAVALGPYVGVLLGLITSNDVGYDGSAFCAHLTAGVRGSADRLGRALAALLVGMPVVSGVAVGGVLLAGHAWLWPAAVGSGLSALMCGIGTSALSSALLPYPVAEAGSNPFRGTSGGGARAALAQGLVLSVTTLLALPSSVLLVVAAGWWPPAAWMALALGLGIGAGVVVAGVLAGGRVMDARGPEILAAVRTST